MGNNIAWCQNPDGSNGESWNPVVGCSAVSPGCVHCWAASFASRGLSAEHKGLAADGKWIGAPRFLPERLSVPLRRRKPTGYAVGLMSDLFHDAFTDEQIAAVFGVMAATPRHRYYVLTKRAERMRRWLEWIVSGQAIRKVGALLVGPQGQVTPWPLPNVYVGVTVEDQERAEERIPHLLATPAAVRLLSVEPMIGAVRLDHLDADAAGHREWCQIDALTGKQTDLGRPCRDLPARIDWVIAGSEAGPRARPCDVTWIRSVVEQCRAAGVPVFVKQLGARPVTWRYRDIDPDGDEREECGQPWPLHLRDRAGGDPSEWPEDLRIRELPEAGR